MNLNDGISGAQPIAGAVDSEPRARSKKELIRTILKQTRPPKGFSQSYFVFEQRRLADELGLLRLEGYEGRKLNWSGSLSVNIPRGKTLGADGKEIPAVGDWDKVDVGSSLYMVLTVESREKTIVETIQGFVKRTFTEGKVQDLLSLPWGKS